jgi:predicted transport protein
VHPQKQTILVYLKMNADTVQLEEGFSRDVHSIGHYGTGDLELRIKDADGFAKAQPLIQQSYSTG